MFNFNDETTLSKVEIVKSDIWYKEFERGK
jgi:hypothetical protein